MINDEYTKILEGTASNMHLRRVAMDDDGTVFTIEGGFSDEVDPDERRPWSGYLADLSTVLERLERSGDATLAKLSINQLSNTFKAVVHVDDDHEHGPAGQRRADVQMRHALTRCFRRLDAVSAQTILEAVNSDLRLPGTHLNIRDTNSWFMRYLIANDGLWVHSSRGDRARAVTCVNVDDGVVIGVTDWLRSQLTDGRFRAQALAALHHAVQGGSAS